MAEVPALRWLRFGVDRVTELPVLRCEPCGHSYELRDWPTLRVVLGFAFEHLAFCHDLVLAGLGPGEVVDTPRLRPNRPADTSADQGTAADDVASDHG